MSRISAMMNMGKDSLMNSQTGLHTVGHNLANKDTKGYTRQRVETQSQTPLTRGNLQVGNGARLSAINRVNNSFLEEKIQKSEQGLGFYEARVDGMMRVEQIYNEQMNKGLSHNLTDFFNSYRNLANDPELMANRTLVKESADSLVQGFNRIATDLNGVQDELDLTVKVKIDEANAYTTEIADLNQRIASVEMSGSQANDERDRRDQVLKELGQIMDITYAEDETGQMTVTGGKVGVLVTSVHSNKLLAIKNDLGRTDVYIRASEKQRPNKITQTIKGGYLGGLVEIRDVIIEELKAKNDAMAYSLAQEVNQAQKTGFTLNNQRGMDLFNFADVIEGAAQRISLNDAVAEDVRNIVTAASSESPGDNSIAHIVAGIQGKKLMEGNFTLDDYYNDAVGKVGIGAKRANTALDNTKNSLEQLRNIRESMSGVSVDEEMTKMVEYQKTYDASAKLIRTADELLDTVLRIKG